MKRYRDTDGSVWNAGDDGLLWYGSCAGNYDFVAGIYGPLTELDNEPEPTPAPVSFDAEAIVEGLAAASHVEGLDINTARLFNTLRYIFANGVRR